jgi:hypothetical protein
MRLSWNSLAIALEKSLLLKLIAGVMLKTSMGAVLSSLPFRLRPAIGGPFWLRGAGCYRWSQERLFIAPT